MYSNNGKLLQCNLRGARLLHLDNGTRQKPHSSGDLVLDSPTIHPYELLTPTQHVDSIPPWVWHVPHFLAVRRGGYSPTTVPFCDIGTLSDTGYVPPRLCYMRGKTHALPPTWQLPAHWSTENLKISSKTSYCPSRAVPCRRKGPVPCMMPC